MDFGRPNSIRTFFEINICLRFLVHQRSRRLLTKPKAGTGLNGERKVSRSSDRVRVRDESTDDAELHPRLSVHRPGRYRLE